MPRKPAELYDVRSSLSGAQVVIGVSLAVARREQARLNAEANIVNPETGEPNGLHCGHLTTYDVVKQASGLVIG